MHTPRAEFQRVTQLTAGADYPVSDDYDTTILAFYESACQEKPHPPHLPEKLPGRFAPAPSGVASQFPRMPQLFSLRPRPLWFPEGVWVTSV